MGGAGFPMGLAEMQDIAMQGEDWPPKHVESYDIQSGSSVTALAKSRVNEAVESVREAQERT